MGIVKQIATLRRNRHSVRAYEERPGSFSPTTTRLFSTSLRNLIQAEDDLDLVGEASTGLAALRVIREQRPDVAVVDISMPELNGIMLSRRVAEELPSTRPLVLTLHEDRAYVNQAMEAGVVGYVLKSRRRKASSRQSGRRHRRALRRSGNRRSDVRSRSQALRWLRAGGATSLTEREAEILKLVALGFTLKETAHRLAIGVKSVETYKPRGWEKLGLRTRAELVRYASAQGWLANI